MRQLAEHALGQHQIIERMRRSKQLIAADNSGLQQTAAFQRIVALCQTADSLIHPLQINLCQKSQLAEVDTERRHIKWRKVTRHLQQCTVTAEADTIVQRFERLRLTFIVAAHAILLRYLLRQHRFKSPVLAKLNKFRQSDADVFFTKVGKNP